MRDIFETARLRFRPIAETDRALYCALYGDEDTMQHIGVALAFEEAHASLSAVLDVDARSSTLWRIWVLHAPQDECDIGIIGIHRKRNEGEIGAMLLAAARRRGYAAEAISALVDMAFRTTDLRVVFTRHPHAHRAANRLMETLAFERRDASAGEVRWSITKEWWGRTNVGDQAAFAIAPVHRLT